MPKKAIILISGGLDSATVLAIAKSQNYECYALSFDYGQRNRAELGAANKVATSLNAKQHRIVTLPLNQFGGSALTDSSLDVPNYEARTTIPATYVPARNTIFLSIALGWAEVLNAFDIFIGANAVDYSGYPDCRPKYLNAFETLANLATKAGIEGKPFHIHAPLLQLTKSEIIQKGAALGVDYALTISCYQPDVQGCACGRCDSCTFRKKGFKEAGIFDPTPYQSI